MTRTLTVITTQLYYYTLPVETPCPHDYRNHMAGNIHKHVEGEVIMTSANAPTYRSYFLEPGRPHRSRRAGITTRLTHESA